jgi:hypothetical protein
MLPASIGATDGHDGFDVLFGEGDDLASPDMQLVLQEMICNPEEKGEAAEHVKESMYMEEKTLDYILNETDIRRLMDST